MSSSQVLLEIKNLTRRTRDGQILLKGIDWTIHASERWGVSGPTGAGKSLLLRCLSRLDVSEGDILWQGCSISSAETPAYRSQVVYLAQSAAMVDGTVEDNLRLPLTLHQHHNIVFSDKPIKYWCDAFGKSLAFLKQQVSDLSGGERQIVALLRALVIEPSVLLLDEATSALDQKSVEIFQSIVENWLSEKPDERAVVWITHSQEQLQGETDHVLQLDNGHIVERVS